MTNHRSSHSQAGFTIVELLIATLVFSTVLLVITFGVIQFSRGYYKGITTSTLQNTARNTIDTIGQAIQFSGTTFTAAGTPVTTYCIGNTQIDFQPHTRRTSANHVLYTTPITTAGGCTPKSFDSTKSRELLDPNMRLVKFSVTKLPVGVDLYQITVRLAYGEDDLLCSPSVAGDCSSLTASASVASKEDLVCKIAAGSQFCAVSELSTIVQRRVK